MGFRSYNLLLTGLPQRLSDAYGTPGTVDPKLDIPYRSLYLQGLLANTATIFIGSTDQVSSTNHGFRLGAADTDAPFTLEPSSPGSPLHLSDFWVLGTTGEVLCVAGVPL